MIYRLQENRAFRSYIGGGRIDKLRGKGITQSGNFPEDWTASTVRAFNPGREDIIEGYGRTVDGDYIKDLIGKDMPILVKLLDSDERLVIQAHPTREFAKEHMNSNVGKAECWYFIDTDEDAHVYAGFKEGITREKWIEMFESQDVEGMLDSLHRFNAKTGDCIFIPGGLPHAIGGGCLMVELQEPSDLMVIPERVTPSGRVLAEAKLHCGLGFEKMFDVFDYSGYDEKGIRERLMPKRKAISENVSLIVGEGTTDIFSMYEISGDAEFELSSEFAVMVVVEGEAYIDGELYRKGETLFVKDEKKLSFKGENFAVALCE
ncbi:MAG: class I mannose-6-phosphate isomerase [Clostridia bacterium]|nr:class I mannose-6-phosphate isomerase [Clostridia bacterium]